MGGLGCTHALGRLHSFVYSFIRVGRRRRRQRGSFFYYGSQPIPCCACRGGLWAATVSIEPACVTRGAGVENTTTYVLSSYGFHYRQPPPGSDSFDRATISDLPLHFRPRSFSSSASTRRLPLSPRAPPWLRPRASSRAAAATDLRRLPQQPPCSA